MIKARNIKLLTFVVVISFAYAGIALAQTSDDQTTQQKDLPGKKVVKQQRDLPGRGTAAKQQRDLPGRGANKQQRDLPGRGASKQRDLPRKNTAAQQETPQANIEEGQKPAPEASSSPSSDLEAEYLKKVEPAGEQTSPEEVKVVKPGGTEQTETPNTGAPEKTRRERPLPVIGEVIEKDGGQVTGLLSKFQDQGYRPEVLSRPERAGYQRYYEEGLGFKVTDFLSASARVEIYQEPIPVESLILNLYQKAWYTRPWPENNIHIADKWNEQDVRNDIRHSFTRAYSYTTIFKINNSLPLWRYTYDRRDMLRVYDEFVDGFKLLMQETHELGLEYAIPYRVPYLGNIVINPIYQRIRFAARGNPLASEDRDRFIFQNLFKHTENWDTFFGYEHFQGKARNTPWIMKPESNVFKIEERLRWPKSQFSMIPGYYYTIVNYRPVPAHFALHELFLELNKDLMPRLRCTQRSDFKWGEVEHEPNSWVSWEKDIYQPPTIKAQSLKERFKLSYEIIKNIDISAEINWSTGLKYLYFDNVGGLWEVELFKPGLIRCRFGYFYNLYYHEQTHAEGFQFRVFMFQ